MHQMNSFLKLNSNWRHKLTDVLYFWSLLQIVVIPLGILVCRCLSLTHLVTFRFIMIYPIVTLFCICLLPHFCTQILKVTYWIFNSTVFQYLLYSVLWIERTGFLYWNAFIIIALFYVWLMVYLVLFFDWMDLFRFSLISISFVSMWWKVRFQYVSSECYQIESETSWETILEVVSFNVKRQMASDSSLRLGIDTSGLFPLKNRLSSSLSQTQFPFLIEKRDADLTITEAKSMRVKLAQSAKDFPKERFKSVIVAFTFYCLGALGFSESIRCDIEVLKKYNLIRTEAERHLFEEMKEVRSKVLEENKETHAWDCKQRKEAYEWLLEEKKKTQRQLFEFYEQNKEAHVRDYALIDKEFALRGKLLGLEEIELDLYKQFIDVLV